VLSFEDGILKSPTFFASYLGKDCYEKLSKLINTEVNIDFGREEKKEKIQELCKDNPDIFSYTNYSGLLPLHVAIFCESIKLIKFLLDLGADKYVNEQESDGKTVVYYAVISGNLDIVKLLIEEYGAEVDFTCDVLNYCSADKAMDMAKYLESTVSMDIDEFQSDFNDRHALDDLDEYF
jgi:ankyrin repeat protein